MSLLPYRNPDLLLKPSTGFFRLLAVLTLFAIVAIRVAVQVLAAVAEGLIHELFELFAADFAAPSDMIEAKRAFGYEGSGGDMMASEPGIFNVTHPATFLAIG
jgi:hypothetical protein